MKANPDYVKQQTRPGTSREERFWSKVERGSVDECWLWQSTVCRKGYGVFDERVAGVKFHTRAHRVAYELSLGHVPDGSVLMHLCHNKRCCNPAHLRPGTTQENSTMSVEAGHYRESASKRRKVMGGEEVDQIRVAFREGVSIARIAKLWRVAAPTIRAVLQGENGYVGTIEAPIHLAYSRRVPLTSRDVQAIRELYACGTSTRKLARRYKRSASAIRRIVSGASF
jgi:hypothetical protein